MWAARAAYQLVRSIDGFDLFIIYQWLHYYFLTNNYLFQVINKNTRAWCKICPKLTAKLSLVYLLLTLNIFHTMVQCIYCWLEATNYQRGLRVVNVRRSILFNITRNWNQTTFKSCVVGASTFYWFLVILHGVGWFYDDLYYFGLFYNLYYLYDLVFLIIFVPFKGFISW